MIIRVLSLFPEMFAALEHSMMGRAQRSGLLKLECRNIRDYTLDKHRRCDDAPFGGGSGMVMSAQPVCDAVREAKAELGAVCVHLSPRGKPFMQADARRFSAMNSLILLCSHYEGLDQRAIDLCVDEEISIGDYVLTGGELAAMVVIDSVCRLIPGVLGSGDSALDESFAGERGLLEYPQYTRPAEFEGIRVPDVLISGHAANIAKWRKEKSLEITRERRPDLL